MLGGLGSVAGGGKFANGAVTAAYGYLFNHLGKAFLGTDAERTLLNWLRENRPEGNWRGTVTVRYPGGSWGFIDLLRGASNDIFEVKPYDSPGDGAKQVANYALHGNYNVGDAVKYIGNVGPIPSTGPFAFLGAEYTYAPIPGHPGVVGWELHNPGQVAMNVATGFVSTMIILWATKKLPEPPQPKLIFR